MDVNGGQHFKVDHRCLLPESASKVRLEVRISAEVDGERQVLSLGHFDVPGGDDQQRRIWASVDGYFIMRES